jgi:DNA-binding MarR family transcriptional regulator
MKDDKHRKVLIDQMQYLGQMASTETALFHQAAAAKNNLGITDMKTISSLLQEGSMTAGEIARRLQLTTGAITNVIDRLESRGLLKRDFDKKDRRKVIVSVDPAKFDNKDSVYSSMGKAFEKLLSNYSTSELEFLVSFYKESIDITKKEIAKLNTSKDK